MKKQFLLQLCLMVMVLGLTSGYYLVGQDVDLQTLTDMKPYRLHTDRCFVPNQVVVKLSHQGNGLADDTPGLLQKATESANTGRLLVQKYRDQVKRITVHPRLQSYHIIETYDKTDIESLCMSLKQEPLVIDASPNYYGYIAEVVPNDPQFGYQYYLRNNGQIYDPVTGQTGAAGSDIKAPMGWEWSTGSETVIVAIVDSGVTGDFEDLAGKVMPGRNYVDGSHNTYDDNGHGTFVASIISANTNNGIGMAGVSWNARILPVKVVAADGYGTYLAIGEGIRYAADQGAHVINVSVGGSNASFILGDACEYAYNRGSLIVCSAGNYNAPVHYPAAYEYCIAVGASTEFDERADWSNYGPELDVVAPAFKILGAFYESAHPDILNRYRYGIGTSYAVPQVAGAAALLLAYKPFLSNTQVMSLIRFTADDINSDTNPGVDNFVGYGRLNIQRLLEPYEL